jgi:hypothetical protein
MSFGDAAVCCGKAAAGAAGGYTSDGTGASTSLPGLSGSLGSTVRPKGAGYDFLRKVEDALQAAIHGSDNVDGLDALGSGAASGAGNVIDFPMRDPYRPLATRPYSAPLPGYTAFPSPGNNLQASRNRFIKVNVFNARGGAEADPPDEANPGNQSLGYVDPFSEIPGGIGLPSGPSKLQEIISGIQNTLPATVAAFRASPQNLTYTPVYQGAQGGAYPVSNAYPAGAAIGSQAGAAVGNVGDTIGKIVAQHPYLVLGGVAAAVLLFMSPPRRR